MKDERLNAALVVYLSAIDAGMNPAPEEFLAAYPEIADELREALAAMEEIGAIAVCGPDHGMPARAASDARPTLDGSVKPGDEIRYFGDYELVEEIARGGKSVRKPS